MAVVSEGFRLYISSENLCIEFSNETTGRNYLDLATILILREELVPEGVSNLWSGDQVLISAYVGRWIVILLFRLQMTIDEAIVAYGKIATFVFSKRKLWFKKGTFKASRLEKVMTDVIATSLGIGKAEAAKLCMSNEQIPDYAKGWVNMLKITRAITDKNYWPLWSDSSVL